MSTPLFSKKINEDSFSSHIEEINGKFFIYVPCSSEQSRKSYPNLTNLKNVKVYMTWSDDD